MKIKLVEDQLGLCDLHDKKLLRKKINDLIKFHNSLRLKEYIKKN